MKEYIVRVYSHKTEWFNKKEQLHREDGPAVEMANGTKEWWINGKLHREDGPAVEMANGTKEWWINGKLHREDDPAFEDANGAKSWWVNGKRHRVDGPAIEYANGRKEWWLNGEELPEEEFLKRTQPIQEMTMEEVCKALGKTIKIVK
jgi:hypothetical protein